MHRHPSSRALVRAVALCAALSSGLATAADYGNFDIGAGFSPDPQTGTGTTGGARDAAQAFGGDCSGSVDTTPDHVITVTSAVNLKLYTTSTTDSTLVLRGPSGTFCDDDSRGELDAEVNAMLRPGRYEVFVGHLGETGQYTLTLTENVGGASTGAGDEGSIEAYRDFTLGSGFTPDPQRSRGETGGSRDARSYGKACVGTIDTTPDHRLTVTSALDLKIFVESTTDSTLVVVGSNRTWCDDDSHGDLDAEVSGSFAPGQYQIFVGTNGDQNGSYTITLTEQ
jgi:hypothetical protein